jgi:hypothetical protein
MDETENKPVAEDGNKTVAEPENKPVAETESKLVVVTETRTESDVLRLGRMKMTLKLLKDIKDDPNIRGVMANFTILEASTDWDSESVEYVALSDLFAPIKNGEDLPYYILESVMSLNEKGEKHYSFKVIRQP